MNASGRLQASSGDELIVPYFEFGIRSFFHRPVTEVLNSNMPK